MKQVFLEERKCQLQVLLAEHKIDAYFLSNLSDLVYFTDYKSEGYYGLISRDDSWLLLPNLLFEQGKANTAGFQCLQGPLFKTLKGIVGKNKLKKIGFDPNQLPYAFGAELVKMGFVPLAGLVSELRTIKDMLEIDRLKEANHLAWRGAEFVRKRLKPGITEKRMSADLAHFFDIEGDGISFDLIIAGGPNSAFPHHITSNYRLKNGDPVVCDIGGLWQGYHSDLTRTYTIGKISPSFSRIFRIVDQSQKAGIKHLKPGVTAGSVDDLCRKIIKKKGFGPQFCHSTGHGVGLDIHEAPRLGPGSKEVLKPGMVVTVEPGIYLPGKFGVRIEDTLLITESGSELLTK